MNDQLHVVREGAGEPVLMSSGMGGAWFDWDQVVPLLTGRHRVIRFDRPGLGLSPCDGPPSLAAEAERLATLARPMDAPVIMVAHSMAAFHAEAFARLSPELVRGLVLVDPSCESRAPRPRPYDGVVGALTRATGAIIGGSGLVRYIGPWSHRQAMKRVCHHPDRIPADMVRLVYGQKHIVRTVLAENGAYRPMAAEIVALRAERPFPPVPLIVITALGDAGDPGCWAVCHRGLAEMSPHGRQVELPDARHMVHVDRPDVVAEAVDACG